MVETNVPKAPAGGDARGALMGLRCRFDGPTLFGDNGAAPMRPVAVQRALMRVGIWCQGGVRLCHVGKMSQSKWRNSRIKKS
jgi:hypothetical protein